MAINTLITIKDAIQAFVDGHSQLKRVVFEADDQRANYITEGNEFPVLFVAPIDVDVTQAMNIHTLRVYVYERVNDDRSDVWENANDTSLILRDLRVWWNGYNDNSDIEILDDPTGNFLVDRELDKLVGYFSDIDFQIPSHGRCDVPVSVSPAPFPVCEPVQISINTNQVENSIPSGDSKNYNLKNQNGDPINVDGVSGDDLTLNIPEASYIVEYENGTLIQQGTIPSGGSVTVEVPDIVPCADASWTLEDSGNNVLNSGTIPSAGSATITAPDATVENSDNSYSDTIESGGLLVLPDTTYNFIVDGVTTSTTIPSIKNETFTIVWQ